MTKYQLTNNNSKLVSSTEELSEELTGDLVQRASETITRTKRGGFLGLQTSSYTEYANPELAAEQHKSDVDKAKVAYRAELAVYEAKGELVRGQAQMQAKQLLAMFEANASYQNAEKLRNVMMDIEASHSEFQVQISDIFETNFERAAASKVPMIRERVLQSMTGRFENLLDSLDRQHQALLNAFNKASDFK